MRFVLAAAALLAGSEPPPAQDMKIGPGGVQVQVTTEYFEDHHHHRHAFQVPADWRDYHHPLGWYRAHPHWWEFRDWYRRAGLGEQPSGIDANAVRNQSERSHS